MNSKRPVFGSFALTLVLAMWLTCNASAQTPPTITNQPISQANLAGATVTFTVGVSGPGPFTYQWKFNGTN